MLNMKRMHKCADLGLLYLKEISAPYKLCRLKAIFISTPLAFTLNLLTRPHMLPMFGQ